MSRALSTLKSMIVPNGPMELTVPLGLLRGTKFNINLRSQMQIYAGIAEKELAPWFQRFSKGARTAIDVGASYGYYTLFFMKQPGIEQVFAFEPSEDCQTNLKKNLAMNKILNSSKLELSNRYVGKQTTSDTTTLDDYFDKIKFPCVVKMDIEGFELQALRGAAKLCAHPGVRWIIEAHSKELETECIHLLQSYGLETQIVPLSPIRLVLPELRPAEHNSWIVAY